MPYTQSKSMSGQGAILSVCPYSASPIAMKEVGELKSWSPSGEHELKDPTNLQSTIREKKPVLYNAGSVSTGVNRVASNEGQMVLQAAYSASPPTLLRITFTLPVAVEAGDTTAGDKWEYTGYCTQFEPDVQGADLVQNRFKLDFAAFLGFTRGS